MSVKGVAIWLRRLITEKLIQTIKAQKLGKSYQGWGLISQFSPFRYFPHFPLFSKQTVAIEYHVYIWQVSSQLSCGDTCQIWMWFRESNWYFCKIENFAYGEISERSFSNPHPSRDPTGNSAITKCFGYVCIYSVACVYIYIYMYRVGEVPSKYVKYSGHVIHPMLSHLVL